MYVAMETAVKNQIINTYLNQQLQTTNENRDVQQVEFPDTSNMEDFKNQVKAWIEIDNQIKKLQGLIRERNNAKKQLTVKILAFMGRYNIEDLNTKDGKLRYKVSQVRKQVNHKEIKSRLSEHFSHTNSIEELTEKVFEPSFQVKHYLRRMSNKAEMASVQQGIE
jgi:hypothetical protein